MTSEAMAEAERSAMRRALEIAATPGVPRGPNPRVGCVLLAPDGSTIAEGLHRGAGTPHAEAAALAEAGTAARGATAVVTLEPCNHTGRTGPCAEALLAAGVRRVVYAQADPNPVARGGAERLRDAGVDVEGGLMADDAEAVNRAWSFAVTHGRPFVTWKFATTLDGRSAAADGTSRWITGEAARARVHALRATVDAIVVGTGTVLADDPALTARDPGGGDRERQPLRVVVGHRDVPAGFRLDAPDVLHLRTHDPAAVLAALRARGVVDVLLEGGPRLAGAFVAARCVDRVLAYLAPALLGAGRAALADAGVGTIGGIRRLQIDEVCRVGEDVLVDAHPRPGEGT